MLSASEQIEKNKADLAVQKAALADLLAAHYVSLDSCGSSKSFKAKLLEKSADNPKLNAFINSLEVNSKDDHYQIFTLTAPAFDSTSSPLEIRFKTTRTYAGPTVEDYTTRVDLRIEALKNWLAQHPSDEPSKAQAALVSLNVIQEAVKLRLTTEVELDPTKLKELDKNDKEITAYFKSNHQKALEILGTFMDEVDSFRPADQTPKQFRNALYQLETRLMSDKKRPERITVRRAELEQERASYIVVNTTKPVHPEHTTSSAKKDEIGLANYLLSEDKIYASNEDGKITPPLYHQDFYRAASPIPHELINRGKNGTALAREIARINLRDDVIPALAAAQRKAGNMSDPLVINYDLIGLISPIGITSLISDVADKIKDPDAAQFKGIRAAMNHYNGRTLAVNIGGEMVNVQFNGIYQNHGVNFGRGLFLEQATNRKAFTEKFSLSLEKIDVDVKALQGLDPQTTKEVAALKILTAAPIIDKENDELKKLKNKLNKIYEKMDNMDVYYARNQKAIFIKDNNTKVGAFEIPLPSGQNFGKEEYKRYAELKAQTFKGPALSAAEKQEYTLLDLNFSKLQQDKKALAQKAHHLEGQVRAIHTRIYHQQKNYLQKNGKAIEKAIAALEVNPALKNNAMLQELVEHSRVLTDYTSVFIKNDKPLRTIVGKITQSAEKRNRGNYGLPLASMRLSKLCSLIRQIGCKSAKDRTGSLESYEKAQVVSDVHHRAKGEQMGTKAPNAAQREKELAAGFKQGYLNGPNNDSAGDNMLPAKQQVSGKDINSDLNIEIFKTMAKLQKGLNKLGSNIVKKNTLENILDKLKKTLKFADKELKVAVDPKSDNLKGLSKTFDSQKVLTQQFQQQQHHSSAAPQSDSQAPHPKPTNSA